MSLSSLPPYQLAHHSLKDKVILITGATRGLGREVALACARNGATTILIGSSVKRLEKVYDEIVDTHYPEPALQPMNFLGVGAKEMDALKTNVDNLFGQLDGIVHCAGTAGQICPLENLPPQKWLQAIHVNCNVPFLLTHAMLPLLQKSCSSNIIFVAEQDALQPQAYWGAYHASKSALLSLSQTFSQELENSSVNVHTVFPPSLHTGLKINHFPGINPSAFLPPEQIATDFIYLLTDHHQLHGGTYQLKPNAATIA